MLRKFVSVSYRVYGDFIAPGKPNLRLHLTRLSCPVVELIRPAAEVRHGSSFSTRIDTDFTDKNKKKSIPQLAVLGNTPSNFFVSQLG